jgi:predicted O-linked N-acetylglucosamine transferase (SPINDLY family)
MAADRDISALHDERKRWANAHATHLLQHRPHTNTPDPERRLRIGYVSADFRMHSAASAFGTILINFDSSGFDVVAYSNTVKKEDALTQRFRQNATCWRKIVGLSDDAVSDLIRQDGIDILIDLSGFSAGNRLLVFARKPAPIQITAWGYASGTGMQAMDVLFSDAVVVPPEEKQFYTEQVRYLPCLLSHSPHQAPPPVNDLPALSAGWITFGSFNRLAKISDEAYRTWAQVLLAVPDSRMVLKAGELDDAGTRARVTGHFTRAGVAPERLSLLGKTSWHEHITAFNRADISLDTFPQGGGVTTLEGLLMGVPVVTLRWPTLSGRTSASILTALGLTDWIAETPEQYVEIAVRKAQDILALAELRQQMRTRFTSSVIGDAHAYVSAVEQEYRQLWREWCVRQS